MQCGCDWGCTTGPTGGTVFFPTAGREWHSHDGQPKLHLPDRMIALRACGRVHAAVRDPVLRGAEVFRGECGDDGAEELKAET